MSDSRVGRRPFVAALLAIPAGFAVAPQTGPTTAVGGKVAAGADRFTEALKLPGGDLVFVKVATQDAGGAFLLTEQPISRRFAGPPRHFHYEQDEWFYCLDGQYVIEIGGERVDVVPGDSVLVPRRVPHAFAFVGDTTGRLLVGFTPAGKMQEVLPRGTTARRVLRQRQSGGQGPSAPVLRH